MYGFHEYDTSILYVYILACANIVRPQDCKDSNIENISYLLDSMVQHMQEILKMLLELQFGLVLYLQAFEGILAGYLVVSVIYNTGQVR